VFDLCAPVRRGKLGTRRPIVRSTRLDCIYLHCSLCFVVAQPDSSGSLGRQTREVPACVARNMGGGVQGYMDTRAQAHAGLWHVSNGRAKKKLSCVWLPSAQPLSYPSTIPGPQAVC
jgi:hypothetical protein